MSYSIDPAKLHRTNKVKDVRALNKIYLLLISPKSNQFFVKKIFLKFRAVKPKSRRMHFKVRLSKLHKNKTRSIKTTAEGH
jgi:hypothetical protein